MRKATLCVVLLFLLISVRSGAQVTKRWYSYAQYIAAYSMADSANIPIWNDTSSVNGNALAVPVYGFNYMTSVGMSFAPVLAAWDDPALFGTTLQVSATDAYTIDTIRIHGSYLRNNAKTAPVDTIFIGFVYGNGTTATNLHNTDYTGLSAYYGYDTLRFLQMAYDSVNNRAAKYPGVITTPYVQYITLTNTDTATNFSRAIPLTTPFPVPAGSSAAVSLTFKSGDASFTHFDTVQYESGAFKYGDFLPRLMFYYNGSNAIYPTYSPLDSNTGYFADESAATKNNGYRGIYVPNWAWTTGVPTFGTELQYPDIEFHISCTTCALDLNLVGMDSVCVGLTTTISPSTYGGTWSSSNSAIAAIGSSSGPGIAYVNGVAAGTATITYTYGGGDVTTVVTVIPIPSVPSISGPSAVCVTSTISLTDATSGGTWSSSNTGIAIAGSSTGIITGESAGTAIISYDAPTGCGTIYTMDTITVETSPSVSAITGPNTVCDGSTIPLSYATSGGVWSSSNTAQATVGSSTGVVSGISSGVTIISYTVTNACGSIHATYPVTVSISGVVGSITGTLYVCAGSTTGLSDATGGGTWSSSNTGVATIGSTGQVTGIAPGTTIISYTLTGSCSAYTTAIFTVNPLPSVDSILGPSSVCLSSSIPLSDLAVGGIWSSTNTAIATAASTGVITGTGAGTVSIRYTVTNSCGTVFATHLVTVNASSATPPIAGTLSVCAGSTTPLSDATGGGIWTSSNTGIATVGSSSGAVSGVAIGTATITYTVSSSCGAPYATATVTVNTTPSAGTITGPSEVCPGSSIGLSDATSGGIWSSSNTAIATVGSSTGEVSGVSAGTVVISYTVTNGCGSASATATIHVNTLATAGTITGASSVCIGAYDTLADAVSGGVWTAINGHAFVSSGGVVIGASAGVDTIEYTITFTCTTTTTANATITVTINPAPNAGTITGLDTVCIGDTVALSDAATGGTWTAANGNAFVSSSGVVFGVIAGSDNITYTVTNTCGTNVATDLIYIKNCNVGINNIQAPVQDITLYPNPAQDNILITSSVPIHDVVISNIVGQQVYTGSYNTTEAFINLSQLSSGVYIARINGNEVRKFVKQ